ncbi:Attractin [Manis pentadactyla]|nr:Attractin [Manis pentadactyla]
MPGSDAQDEPIGTKPPLLAIIFWSPPAPHEAVGSTTFGLRAGNDARDEPMDMTPPTMAVIFWSPTAPHGTVGLLCTPDTHRVGSLGLVSPGTYGSMEGTDDGLGPTHNWLFPVFPADFPLPRGAVLGLWTVLGSQQMAGERPPRRAPPLQVTQAPLPAGLLVSCLCKTTIHTQPTDKALGSTIAGLMIGSDARDEPINTTPPPLAIVFRSPPAPNEAVGSTTVGLLCTSDNHRMGGRHLVSPGSIRCHGRHRRWPQHYTELGL